MLADSLRKEIEQILLLKTGSEIQIKRSSSLSGGSINNAYRLETGEGYFFMKYNRASAYPGMFEQEALGLELLRQAGAVRVPEVVGHGDDGTYSFIILEYLDPAGKAGNFWEGFGRKLAALHRHEGSKFGLDHDNYIGSLKQYNDEYDSWADFFREQRLGVQIEMASRSGLMPGEIKSGFESLFKRLDDMFQASFSAHDTLQ